LNYAWQKLIERHDMLRGVIRADGTQQILKTVPFYEFKVYDLRNRQDAEECLHVVRDEMSHQVLPADTWPLFDIRASRINEQRVILHISIDALIADVWSGFVIFDEWYQLYQNSDAQLEPLKISFRDYVIAKQKIRDLPLYNRDREYWLKRLPDFPPAPELPLAVNPDSIKKPKFKRREAVLPVELWERLKEKAKRNQLTPSGVLLSAYSEVLRLWSKNPDMTINITLFNRFPLHPQVNNVVGDFTSLIPLKVINSPSEGFVIRAQRLQRQLWQDIDHPYFEGSNVIREMARMRGTPRKAVLPVVFTSALSYTEGEALSLPKDIPIKVAYSISQTPQVWLDHQVYEQDGNLLLTWDAVEELFPEGLLDDMFNAYISFLKHLAVDDGEWDKKTPELLPIHQQERRVSVNATDMPVSPEMLHTLFAAQVSKRPKQPAVVSSARTLSYKELFNRSNQIGKLLRENGAEPNKLVAIVMEKNWEQIVAALGILQSGAAYLPIDSATPRERLWHLLKDGEVSLVLTQSWLDEKLEWPEGIKRFSVDKIKPERVVPLDIKQKPDDLAYVIYTSGSTGLPKGVMIDHRGAVNTILDINRRFGVGPEDKVLALSRLSFDLSVYDIFGTLAAGGTVVLPEESGRRDPAHWLDLMNENHITIWNSVPAMMQMLVEYAS
ncbi:MAG: AMP-binding protein, partial [Deltaproteobacteria bacterium]|nr:AMP-binding protein [Deltaproteobacteria bacterium]